MKTVKGVFVHPIESPGNFLSLVIRMTSEISDKQLLDKISFVKWKNAVQAINDYINKRLDELNEIIETHKDRCSREIIPQIAEFKPRVGMELKLEEFERYVELHRQLSGTMLDIQSACKNIYDEIDSTLNDCMKLIDQKSPLYLKFMQASNEEKVEKSPIFIMIFVTFLVLMTTVTGYLIIKDNEWDNIVKSTKVYKKFT